MCSHFGGRRSVGAVLCAEAAGGIVGRIVSLREDTLVIETGSDRTKIRFRRSAISAVEKLEINKDSKEKKETAPVKK